MMMFAPKYNELKFNTLVLIAFLYFHSVSIQSQTFRRIETLAGITSLTNNHGVAAADIDGDYDIDLFIVGRQRDDGKDFETNSKLYINNNDGTYTDITIPAGLVNLHTFEDNHENDPNFRPNFSYDGYKFGASWGDYDNDGDPDLFLSNAYRVQLFRNNGDLTFTQVTEQAGFTNLNRCLNSSSVWLDYDNDGYLDIYLSDYGSSCSGNQLFRNQGDGTFSDVTSSVMPSVSNLYTYMMFPYDFNKDGLLDFYTSNDYDSDNRLFISNVNGQPYTESSRQYLVHDVFNSMGVDFGDYDDDGEQEIFATTINSNSFFKKSGITYNEISESLGVHNSDWSWDTKFWDFNNNGFLDLFVANGFRSRNDENKLYINNRFSALNNFTDKAEDHGLNYAGYSCSSVPIDFDNDGDLDLFVTNVYNKPIFYENNTIGNQQGSDKNWVKVFLKGVTSNKNGLGAKLVFETNQKKYYRYNFSVGLYSQNLLPIHVGLKDAESLTSLEIVWPSGETQKFENLGVNKHFEVVEGGTIQELNINPSIKRSGCTNPNACNYDPLAFLDNGSCTYLSPGQISGPTSSSFLETDSYSYTTASANPSFSWNVTGGEIVSGQGTNQINVKWHVEDTGKITLIESGDCDTEPIVYNVELTHNLTTDNFSVARIWNEILLEAIRNDFARPTVHARNLFHTSVAMYDIWAIHNSTATPYLIGKNNHGFSSVFDGFSPQGDPTQSINKALSYAVYKLLKHRFANSPGFSATLQRMNMYMNELGFSIDEGTMDYTNGNSIGLGNFVAQTIINYGLQDGSNEASDYANLYYQPVNQSLITELSGINVNIDPNRWQPLSFNSFIDQSGNVIGTNTPDFLSPEWGNVSTFSLTESDKTEYTRSNHDYNVFVDPGSPPYLDSNNPLSQDSQNYKWGFSLVSLWSAHLDPTDNVMWDISPKSIGNIQLSQLPTNFNDYNSFYKEFDGGDISTGRGLNPTTNQPYQEQMVPRGDYTRVLAEFWADGPDSETPPGHWYTLLNYVNDHPSLIKKLGGSGNVLNNLEWDVKAYFTLGGAMHDAAISAWSVKGWYDYIRPISAIRYMCSLGQSTDPNQPSYHEKGIPLVDGYVELIESGDPLQGANGVNIGKVKLKAWKGHAEISNPDLDQAGVDWILGESWMPYQRPSFVTPPFAGYVSGHSTYSRAAAEILTFFTGDEYFPGGMGEFVAKKNEFLVFEEGPSMDVILQWATYRDASDQCSLSRIWGGIHPPADDIPGRIIGEEIGRKAFDKAIKYFDGSVLSSDAYEETQVSVYPNPLKTGTNLTIDSKVEIKSVSIYDVHGREIRSYGPKDIKNKFEFNLSETLSKGVYMIRINETIKKIIVY